MSLLPRNLSRQTRRLTQCRLLPQSQSLLRPTIQLPATSTCTPVRRFNLPSLSSFLPSSNNNNNNNGNGSDRTLTATRTLPYPPQPLFDVIASVESYSQFLPFLTESTVTARDPQTGYPSRAFLTVGYGPLSETFTSRVDCDRNQWVVEARSGAKFGVDSKDGQDPSGFPGANEGIFEYLSTKWELIPQPSQTEVRLQIRFEFRSQFHAMMMSAVEAQMAGVMIEAFEKRIQQVVRK
ncbi:hypothetical protein BDV59DRAFT_203330 [Aspergillus ambiguus]|uniref:ubiquinone-binding COQ10-like protein n=1 Tax=Aspergillus ambiguus TaxID=176160 RepID=UPI003CCE3C1C